MTPVQILHEMIGSNVAVITIIGQLDESNVDEKSKDIYAVIQDLPHNGAVIFNLSGLEYMNSKSIGYTMDFFNKMNEKEGVMIIAEPQEQIEDILNVVGAAQVITIVSSLQEAENIVEEKVGIEPQKNVAMISKHEELLQNEASSQSSVQQEAILSSSLSEPVVADINNEIASYLQIKQEMPRSESSHTETETPKIVFGDEFSQSTANAASFDQSPTQESQTFSSPNETTIAAGPQITGSQPIAHPVKTSQKPEAEFPILGIAVVIGLTIIVLALIFK